MHIDVFATTIGALLIVQGGGALFWGGLMTERVRTLEKAVEPIATLRTDMAALAERMKTLIGLLEAQRQPRASRVNS